jgi:muramoyltetrapeptide carboxypeptidase LdcA involved in peptidoglycan recycling
LERSVLRCSSPYTLTRRRPRLTTHGHGFVYPDKPRPGDRVAILSPSMGLPAVFPKVHEQGLRRIREVFGLVPVEYPTTRTMNAPLRDRARDVHAAFADPAIKAIITSIGGEDQIKLLKHLDPELIGARPKPFFGYSDNTNLHAFLWNLGIVSYHGGSVMVQFGRGGAMHPYTAASLRRALFERGEVELTPAPEYTDEDLDWAESGTLTREPPMFPNAGWTWLNGADRIVEGIAWGGSLEILDFHLRASRYLLPPDAYEGAVLYLETSEEMPSAAYVYRVLMCMAERGLLQRFPAVLVARPKAWSFERPSAPEEKARFVGAQEEAIRRVLDEYHPRALAVFGLDFGHTDPQCVVPNGGRVRIDGVEERIRVTY